jgi:ATP-binding cassette subfamily G (WHITE) protein 8 (sterolin 2)
MAILSVIVQWQSERVVYTRELAEGMYSATPYYFSKILSELPFDIVLNFLHCVIVYWMVNLNRSFERFMIFYVIILLEIYCSQSFGYVCAAAIPNFLSASTAANAVFTLFFLPAGWAINYASIPKAFSWVKEISYFKYGYEALVRCRLKSVG